MFLISETEVLEAMRVFFLMSSMFRARRKTAVPRASEKELMSRGQTAYNSISTSLLINTWATERFSKVPT